MSEFLHVILRKFESYGTCPKCKASTGDLDITWCTGGVGEGPCVGLVEGYEHLHIRCGKCGYPWLSDTADADERRRSAPGPATTAPELTISNEEGGGYA